MNTVHITQEQADEFALGAMGPEVTQALLLHADVCFECRLMVSESRRVAAALALGVAYHRPPPELRRRVLRSAGILRPGPLTWAARLVTAGAGVAAVVVAIAAFTGMVSVRGQIDDVRRENQALQARLDNAVPTRVELLAITRRLSDAERTNTELFDAARGDRDLLLALLSPESDVADVIAVNDSEQAIGRFVWDDGQKKAWFVANRLQSLKAGQTYQLWINADGRYLSLGTFNSDASGFARLSAVVPQGLKSYESAVVTVETAPGAPERSGPSVFVTDLSRLHR